VSEHRPLAFALTPVVLHSLAWLRRLFRIGIGACLRRSSITGGTPWPRSAGEIGSRATFSRADMHTQSEGPDPVTRLVVQNGLAITSMDRETLWHGCLLSAWVAALTWAATPPDTHQLPQVRSQTFEIEFQVNEAALPLREVELWYTRDSGRTWQHYGPDDDCQSPIHFAAQEEGLYGFFVVAVNDVGLSSDPPGADTQPQQWAFVDFTPPVVQLHPPRIGNNGGLRVLHLKWTAIDAHLTSRPVELSYRLLPAGPWRTIASALSNTGRYDWRPDEEVTGRIMVRISVRDRGDNKSEAATVVNLDEALADKASDPLDRAATTQPRDPPPAPTEADLQRAQRLLQQGTWHRLRGEHRLAISRLRDALHINPDLTEALVELGGGLYDVGNFEESARAYELALAQDSRSRPAVQGVARAYMAARRYDDAAARLQEWVRSHAEDAQAWLNLGDVQMWRGDELSAAESYRTASTADPEAKDVIAKAQMRLDNLSLVRERVGRLVESEGANRP
jgi:Flp pilus assembly protein TadD